MLRNDIPDRHIPVRTGCRKHVGARLDLIRNDRILGTVKLRYSDNTNDIRPGTFDIRTHTVQEIRHIDNMRLLRTVFNHRAAFRHRRRHHDVDRRPDGNRIQKDVLSDQIRCRRTDNSALYDNLRSEGLESLQMQVDRS